MTDAKKTVTDGSIVVPWTVEINGLLQGNVSSINTRFHNTIDQAFAQSPYLNH